MSDDRQAPADWKLRATVRVGLAFIHALARTWRVRAVNAGALDRARADGRPFVFAFWHGQILPMLWQHRGEGQSVLISSHRDGEIIARIAEGLGYRTIRGSTSRGAGRALLSLVRELERGSEVAVTPDGPRGPARKFALGALIAAHRADVPIVALGARASRAWRLKSWDGFMIPKPFARVTITYADPERVLADTVREVEHDAPRFEEILASLSDRVA